MAENEEVVKFKFFSQSLSVMVVLLYFLISAHSANAASLYFSPNSGTKSVGSVFSVGVYLESRDESSNAVSAVINFPKDKVDLQSISRAGSIISLWVQEPAVFNGGGAVRFEGIVLNPGYKGAGGRILTLNFKARSSGTGNLGFSSGSVLANDGQGTNILTGLGNAKFAFTVVVPPTKPLAATTPVYQPAVPNAPQIVSPSHPNPAGWFADNDPLFNWRTPTDTVGVSYSIDRDSGADPGTRSKGVFSQYTAKDVGDGSWYFHLRLQNKSGWGSISHYRFQVDTAPPQPFDITALDGVETDNPTPRFTFNATDTLSGIDFYQVKINNSDYLKVPFGTLPASGLVSSPQLPGKHTVIVEAIDRAGNSTVSILDIVVRALAPPQFKEFPSTLELGDALVARGESYPNSDVAVYLSGSGEQSTAKVRSDENGNFVYVAPHLLAEGLYQLTAQAIDERGGKSEYSAPITIAVQPTPFIKFGTTALNVMALFVPALSLLILSALILFRLWRKFRSYRGAVRREVKTAEELTHQSFTLLRENLKKYISALENAQQTRRLTLEEEAILTQLKNDYATVEEMISKELKNIAEAT